MKTRAIRRVAPDRKAAPVVSPAPSRLRILPQSPELDLPPPSRAVVAAICVVLAIVTVAVYAQVYRHGFIEYRDGAYVRDNDVVKEGLTLENIGWAFTTFNSGHWHPLTWLSLMLDCRIFGVNPGAVHLINVLYHVAAALLIFLAFVRMTNRPWRSAFVAAVFALHPMHVESVAWISERKDVLGGVLASLTLLLYIRYAAKPSVLRYMAILLAFALALMAHSIFVTIPFVFLLLDVWPLNRLPWPPSPRMLRVLIIEKAPLITMSVAAGVVALIARRHSTVLSDLAPMSFFERIANVPVAYASYVGKALLPSGLALLYPGEPSPAGAALICLAFLAAVTFAAFALVRKRPYCLVGWCWFVGMLVPVIGLIRLGSQFMADRYTYFPLVGLSFAVVWLIVDLCRDSIVAKRIAAAALCAVLVAFAALSFRQAAYWSSSETLFRRTIAVTAPNPLMHALLAITLKGQGRVDEAVVEYRQAIAIRPYFARAHNGLGLIYDSQGKEADALAEFEAALATNDDFADAHNNIGAILERQGRRDEALAHYLRAAAIQPDSADAHDNLARVYAAMGNWDQAQAESRMALAIDPDDARAHNTLGLVFSAAGNRNAATAEFNRALALAGDLAEANTNLARELELAKQDDALDQCQKTLQTNPDDAQSHNVMGTILADRGQRADAIAHYNRALEIDPNYADAHANLAHELMESGEMNGAYAHLKKAIELQPTLYQAHADLGIILAAQGRFDEAAKELHESLLIKPDQPIIHADLGYALTRLNRFDEAVAECNLALKLDPNLGNAHYNLATALAARGDTAAASAEFSKVLSLDPSNSAARSALESLQGHK